MRISKIELQTSVIDSKRSITAEHSRAMPYTAKKGMQQLPSVYGTVCHVANTFLYKREISFIVLPWTKEKLHGNFVKQL
jgi:hypothetical protein